jgi:Leucine-rich repeat (LRR) protein
VNKTIRNIIIILSTAVILATGAVLYFTKFRPEGDTPEVTNYVTAAPLSTSAETAKTEAEIQTETAPVNTDITQEFPDENFRAAIRASLQIGANDPIMSENAANLTVLLYPQNNHAEDRSNVIRDLTGIELLENLETLDVSGNEITALPDLPSKLKSLNVSFNQLTALPLLPESLEYFDCGRNRITKLPALPETITELDVNGNILTSLPPLPSGLIDLDCYDNKLTSLPALPDRLNSLSCGINQLTELPSLPAGLFTLDCNDNQIAELPALPETLTAIMCGNNGLTALPVLPDAITYISVFENNGGIDIDEAVFADGSTVAQRLENGTLEIER